MQHHFTTITIQCQNLHKLLSKKNTLTLKGTLTFLTLLYGKEEAPQSRQLMKERPQLKFLPLGRNPI